MRNLLNVTSVLLGSIAVALLLLALLAFPTQQSAWADEPPPPPPPPPPGNVCEEFCAEQTSDPTEMAICMENCNQFGMSYWCQLRPYPNCNGWCIRRYQLSPGFFGRSDVSLLGRSRQGQPVVRLWNRYRSLVGARSMSPGFVRMAKEA